MFTPKQVADSLNLSSTTIRNYSRVWAEYLSPAANPEAGLSRQYSEDDLAVLTTIAALRDNQATTEQIRAALDAGERLEPMRPFERPRPADQAGEATGHDQQAADQARAAVNAAESAIAIYRDRVTAVEARNQELTDRLISAEARAAASERELAILREMYEAASNPDPGRKMSFWEWVQSRRR